MKGQWKAKDLSWSCTKFARIDQDSIFYLQYSSYVSVTLVTVQNIYPLFLNFSTAHNLSKEFKLVFNPIFPKPYLGILL
jgi:hypothetical protein